MGIENEIFSQPSGNPTIPNQDPSDFDAPEISPQEKTEHLAQRVAHALEATGLMEIVKVEANLINQIHIMVRIDPDNEREVAKKIFYSILRRTEGVCKQHICKQIFLKGGRMKYAWCLSFGSDNILKAAHAICDAVEEVIPPVEVVESPLMGPGTSSDMGKGKGAKPVKVD